MGCDIHTHVEYLNHNNEWCCGDYFRIGGEKVPFMEDRNYSLFATLANVRNYGDTDFICKPKGLPNDACKKTNEDYDDWAMDAHSASWFTLKELIDFQNEHHKLKYLGMISPEAQENLDNGITPNTWCQCTNVKGWEIRHWEEDNEILVPMINALKEKADDFYVIAGWQWETNPEEAYKKSERIRIVFWFDN